MFSSPTSRWTAGGVAACVGLVAVTYVGLVGPRRGEADQLSASAASTQQQSDALQVTIAQLKAQFATLPQRQAELATVLGQVPVDAAVPTVVRSFDQLAATAGVRLDGVTPGAAQVIDAKGHPTDGHLASSGSGAVGQLVGVPISVVVRGPYFKTVTFLKELQSAPRAFLVTGLQVATAGADVTLTVRGRVFALPGASAALATLQPSAAPAGAATTSSGGPAPSPSVAPAP